MPWPVKLKVTEQVLGVEKAPLPTITREPTGSDPPQALVWLAAHVQAISGDHENV